MGFFCYVTVIVCENLADEKAGGLVVVGVCELSLLTTNVGLPLTNEACVWNRLVEDGAAPAYRALLSPLPTCSQARRPPFLASRPLRGPDNIHQPRAHNVLDKCNLSKLKMYANFVLSPIRAAVKYSL